MSELRGRAVALTNGVVAAVLVAVLAALALVVNPPAPPGIAEFAPQASKPITKAPAQQAAQHGDGGTSCAGGGVCVGPSASARPVPSPSSTVSRIALPPGLQCYEWADGSVTQTPDPQSPPCVADWPEAAMGNGGTTTRGVSGTEIRVGLPYDEASSSSLDVLAAMATYMNRHFQLYHRRIVPVRLPWQDRSPEGQRAMAVSAAEHRVFASLIENHQGNERVDLTTWFDTLASNKVIGVMGETTFTDAHSLARLRPYAWSYAPLYDARLQNVAAATCGFLAGHPARPAGFTGKTRRFAILYPESEAAAPMPPPTLLRRGLSQCGVDAPVYEYPAPTPPGDRPALQAQAARLSRDGVTTLIYVRAANAGNDPWFASASAAGYHPEWILTGNSVDRSPIEYMTTQPDQATNTISLGSWNKARPDGGDALAVWKEVRPGKAPPMGEFVLEMFYKAVLLLASGIQMAGPGLTPDTFGTALQTTVFPNPGAGGRPYYQGTVGLDSRPDMVRDFALMWWNPSTGEKGDWCYAAGGRRWHVGSWPRTDPGLFDDKKGC